MPHFLPEDSWKEVAIEKARIILVERLRVEKVREVQKIVSEYAKEILTNKQND